MSTKQSNDDPIKSIVFATRPSALARSQTRQTMLALQAAWPGLDCAEKIVTTSGDRILDRPLPEIGGKGLFTQELENELLDGKVQAAVHSLKDLPVQAPHGTILAAIPARADARDVLVSPGGHSLDSLPEGAITGTSSLRRAAQLLAQRPDLRIVPLRGNIDTRLKKAMQGQYDAIILAGAGLIRLNLEEYITQWLPLDVMLPAPGQGALAVQCRADDAPTRGYIHALEDPNTRNATIAERAFLTGLGGGCSLPVAAYAIMEQGIVHLQGLAAAPDGSRLIRVKGQGQDPWELGHELAQQALAAGANEILSGASPFQTLQGKQE